jgi:quercetin dioxygenase-like cupin family protein
MTASQSQLIRRRGEGPRHDVLGMAHEYKLLASESGGAFMQFIATVPPGHGAPMHNHDRDGESFFILEGEITARFEDGSSAVAGAGDFLWFPPNVVHSFANEGAVTARALVVQSPGLEAEHFFGELDAMARIPGFMPERDVPEVGGRNGVRVRVPADA